jgi:hypothetical protein
MLDFTLKKRYKNVPLSKGGFFCMIVYEKCYIRFVVFDKGERK